VSRATGSLLTPRLRAPSSDETAVLRSRRPAAPARELGHHDRLHQVGPNRRFEHSAVELARHILKLDLDVHARSELELHQSIDCLRRGVQNVDQTPVRPDLELLPRFLVDVRAPEDREPPDAVRTAVSRISAAF
jgi:hypothetical protein